GTGPGRRPPGQARRPSLKSRRQGIRTGAMSYAIKNLREVKDSAEEAGVSDSLEARFAHEDVGAEQTGFSYQVVKAGKRQPFAHKHGEMEEVYVVISGSGRLKLDDELEDVKPLDAIRISPE